MIKNKMVEAALTYPVIISFWTYVTARNQLENIHKRNTDGTPTVGENHFVHFHNQHRP